jgi:RNA polymerase sigma-70 factor, ECF subfamily
MTTSPSKQDRHPNDWALLEAWRQGDKAAGDALFVRHYRSVARFFRNKLPAERVADLIQETFIASIEGRDRIADASRFRAYLLTIAYRVYCKELRENYRKAELADLDLVSVQDLGGSPTSAIARAQEQRLLLEGLRSIPVNYQVVLELHYWEDLTTREIAAVLGVPPGTVRSRLQRGRDALEAAMASLARSPKLLESTLTRLDDWAARCRRELSNSDG